MHCSNIQSLKRYKQCLKWFNLLIGLCQPSSSELNCTQLIQFWALLSVSDELRRLLCFCFVSKIIVRINNFVSLERQMILFNTVHWGRHSLINRFQVLSLFLGQLNWSLKISLNLILLLCKTSINNNGFAVKIIQKRYAGGERREQHNALSVFLTCFRFCVFLTCFHFAHFPLRLHSSF